METNNNTTNNNNNSDNSTQSNHELTAKQLKRQRIRQIAVSLIGVAILVWGIVKIACMFMDYKSNEKSDDAQIEQYISPVNMRASGYIKKIYFKEHQDVKKGDTLLVLDDREYRIRVMEAVAALKDAMAGANVVDASLQTTQTSATVYEASIAEIEIRLAKLDKDRQRYQNLVARNAATPIQLEQIETEYNATKKKLDAVRRQQKAAYSGVNEVQTRKKNTAAAIERTQAALEMAKLNLSYCVVTAPCDGKLGRRALEEGQAVNAGQTITYIMPNTQKWVIANYKETQVEKLYVGQKVKMSEQYISPVNMRASGYIKKIYFKEHQDVKKGDTLLVLDDREYRIRVMEAVAALKDAMAGANVVDASLQTTQTSATVYEASIAEIEIRLAKLDKDRQRYQNLVARNAATPIQLEQIETEYNATKKKLDAVRRQQKAAYSGVNEVQTRKKNTAAAIERTQAALEMAKLNLSYCVVTAPCDGKLGRRALEEGQAVNAGQTITYIMPNTQKWVIANYKETQVEKLYVGQKVKMSVDAFEGKEFEGRITAISGATGSKYSLVPTDNSAGNFVKIQQRVPVRIEFEGISKEDNNKLAAGMMVVVKAQLK